LGDRLPFGLGYIPHVRRPDPDHPGAHDLAGAGFLAAAEPVPGFRVVGVAGVPCNHRGEDLVAGLALEHVSVELLPLPVAGDVGGEGMETRRC
jgi:hypothetical protein